MNDGDFGVKFRDKLEGMAVREAEKRIFDDDKKERIKSYGQIPVYAFNFMDYVLWKRGEELKEEFFNATDFCFTYRRSIEYWFPQNPNEEQEIDRIDDSFLHSFGNLCIITNSQNSKFSNLSPSSKYNEWEILTDKV